MDTLSTSSIENPTVKSELSIIEAEEVIAISAKSIFCNFDKISEET